MDALVTTIMVWLAANFDLPNSVPHPQIRLVSQDTLIEVRMSVLETEEEKEKLRATIDRQGHVIVALYDDVGETIYLRQDWSANSPADVSVLVHELVHHLQNVGGLTYPCE